MEQLTYNINNPKSFSCGDINPFNQQDKKLNIENYNSFFEQ